MGDMGEKRLSLFNWNLMKMEKLNAKKVTVKMDLVVEMN